jgi:hypothetical protein
VLSRTPASAAERRRIMLRVYSALWMMRDGTAGREEWCDCADALNICEELANRSKAPMPERIVRAQAHMALAMENWHRTGRMTMQPEGVEIMQQIAGMYDEALARFSRQTMAEAAAGVVMRIAAGRKAGVQVVE